VGTITADQRGSLVETGLTSAEFNERGGSIYLPLVD
jgi:hypothetical protein